jgi:hypothetical protein
VPAARVAGAAVVLGTSRLCEDDGTLVAQLLDKDIVARREIDVIGRVTSGGGAHVFGVERVLEREDDAVHRHLFEVGVAPIGRIELGRALERIGGPPEVFADRRRVRRQKTLRQVPIEVAAAGHRALASDVERGERAELPGVGLPGNHAVLLLNLRIGNRRLHAPEFERRPPVFVEIRQDL